MMSNATVVFYGQSGADPATTSISNMHHMHGMQMSACESIETTTGGACDTRNEPVTIIPSYNLQGADQFIMPALSGSNDTAQIEKDFGIQEQLASISQILFDVQSKQSQMALELQNVRLDQQLMNERVGRLLNVPDPAQGNDSALSEEDETTEAETKDRKRFKERLKKEALRSAKLQKTSTWQEYLFGICSGDQRMGKEGNSIIHPHSLFMQVELLFSGLLLVYTAIIAPVQICMWEYEDPCNIFPTMYFDVFVDAFFLAETLLMFFVGFYCPDQTYIHSLPHVITRYLSTPTLFWFDAVTSIPFSCLDLAAYQNQCKVITVDGLETVPTSLTGESRVLRVFKIFRILKVLRLLKLVKLFGLIGDYAVIFLGSNFFKILRLLTIVIFAVHFFACAFWRVAREYRTPEELDAWLSGKHVPRDVSQRPNPVLPTKHAPTRRACIQRAPS
jgi:hypothetical protein